MKRWPCYVLALLVILIDQWTKHLALSALAPYQSVELTPFLNLTLAFNTGAAFSFLNNASGWQTWLFGGLSATISLVLVVLISRLDKDQSLTACSLSLILGGALGNLIDRIVHGHVIDFIDAHVYSYHWPVFNIADSAICIGAVLFGIVMLRES